MNEKCPNCGQLVNTSFSRLVKDSCGHTKCRMCLVYEAHGCKICQAERNTQDYLAPCSMNGESNNTNKSTSEEIMLPLELVINKDSKSKENYSDSISTECRSLNPHHDNVTTFDNNIEAYKPATNDTVTNDDSDKVYIPKIETHDVVLNIHAHLRNENNSEIKNKNDGKTASLQNPQENVSFNDNQVQEEKVSEEIVKKNKNVRSRDRSHIMILPGNPERYKCNACGKIFRNKKGKCYHDACVTGIKPYQCTFCDKTFVKRSHFEYHERVHKGYKPYKCNLCEKAFPQQNKLNRHMFSHKEKQFLCPECNKRYSKRDDLKNHLSIHNATTMYNCKSCDKSFRVLSNLKRHLRTHTSERPHTCDQCNKSFKDRSLLIRHKRTHGKERPFSCANCNRVFLSKSELRRHLTVHLDEKPFACEYCQTLFRRKDNLNRHIRHHHSEDSNCEVRKTAVEADRSCSAKSSQQRQRQKPKRTQPKSPGKVTTTFANSRDQINSRLDSMGNITPVIRTTSEVSNAVPVINGPINIRRLEEKTDKKIFTYTEPIPIAEAVVLNCRIEEKLYPQSASSHNHFVRSYLMDRNSKVNSYPNNKPASQENHNSTTFSQCEPRTEKRKDPVADVYKKKIMRTEKERDKQIEEGKKDEESCEKERNCDELKEDLRATSLQRSNYVSTIKKHTTQQSEGHLIENSTNNGDSETTNQSTMPKDFQNSCQKKQSGVHWRRRITETLKPC